MSADRVLRLRNELLAEAAPRELTDLGFLETAPAKPDSTEALAIFLWEEGDELGALRVARRADIDDWLRSR